MGKKGREPLERDHIWPRAEGGPDKEWNFRSVPRSVNRRKGARMPTPSEVLQSPNMTKLATEIDKNNIGRKFRHRSNKDKGFGGLNRY